MLLALSLFAVASSAALAVVEGSTRLTSSNEHRVTGSLLAERALQSLALADPLAPVPATRAVAVGDTSYTISSAVHSVRQDGPQGRCGVGPDRTVAQRLSVTVDWPRRPSGSPLVRLDTLRTVDLAAVAPTSGTLAAVVEDSAGTPQQGASVTLGSVGSTATTDVNGCAVFLAVPSRSDYTLTVSRSGWSDPTGLTQPSRAPVEVVPGRTTEEYFTYGPATLNPPSGFTASTSCSPAAPAAFRSAVTATTNGATSLTIARPPGTVAGDVLLAQVAYRRDTSSPMTAPAGWALQRVDTHTGQLFTHAVWSRVAAAGDPSSWTWGLPTSDAASGAVLAYSGVDTARPVDAVLGQGNAMTTSITAPSVTTSTAGTVLVSLYGIRADGTVSAPSGQTVRSSAGTTKSPGSANTTIVAADEVRPAAGATGTRTATSTVAGYNAGTTLALTPAAPPPVSARLDWTPTTSPLATGYRLRRSRGGLLEQELAVAGVSTSTATSGPLERGTTYTFQIAATDGTAFSSDVSRTLSVC